MAKTYKPTSGMASAARRALQWKKEGRRGGTRVGLARANQLVNREPLSESTVMRMYSFFSRHEVDKKAEGFNSGEKGFPSPGRVAWDLWGGDAGASWSRQKRNSIMNSRMNKSIWAGVFFPVDEPELKEEDAPLPDQIEDIVIPEEVVSEVIVEETVAVEAPAPEEDVVEEAAEESVEEPVLEETVEETVEDVVETEQVEETVVEQEASVEVVAEESSPEPEAVVESQPVTEESE